MFLKRFGVDGEDRLPNESSLHEVCRTCRTSPAKTKNVRRRAPVKFNQMSDEEVEMSGIAQKNFVYTVSTTFLASPTYSTIFASVDKD